VTPDQERKANEIANKILIALRDAKTPAECAAIAEKSAKAFARLEEVHPVRALHIMNAAAAKKREFASAPKTVSTRGPRRRVAPRQDEQGSLFD
jgi:hypothetical protein